MQTSLLPSLAPPLFSLSPLQSQVDGLVGGFVETATDWRTLAAMTAGGFAYRAGRIGILGLEGGPSLRAASVGVGLTAEVSTFELTHRSLGSLSALHHPSSNGGNPNLWRWNGNGGLRQGLLQSLVTFGALKGAGRLAQGENLVAQHLFQDTAMVLGHRVTGALGITPSPTGSLAEQFLHAEATNLQIGAGMTLSHAALPGLHGMERGLDLSLSARESQSHRGNILPFVRNPAALALEGPPLEQGYDLAQGNNVLMSSSGESGRPGGPIGEGTPTLGALPERAIEEAETPRAPLVSHGVLSRLADRRVYSTQLLRFSQDHLLNLIQEGNFSASEAERSQAWLSEVEEVQRIQNSELLELGSFLAQAERSGALVRNLADPIKAGEEFNYSRLRRVREQLDRVRVLLSEHPTFQSAAEIRRRMDWVFSVPEFARDFDWQSTPLADSLNLAAFGEMSPHQLGVDLLIRLHPGVTQADIDIYERAAAGVIRGRDIAFDLNKTLVGTYLGYNMDGELRNHPEKYNGATFSYFAHQNLLLRTPFRGVEALLLGLWAAGNRLSLYTADHAEKTHLNTLFNDFPLLKIPFGLATPEDPFPLVSHEDLYRSARILYEEKRAEFQARHFGNAEGTRFLGELSQDIGVRDLSFMKNSKIPFPEFPFELLVDDSLDWPAELETLGFGRRWVLATGNAETTLKGIEEYFSKALPETSLLMQNWLAGRTNSLTSPKAPDTLEDGKGQVITMEQAQLMSLAKRLMPHRKYFESLEIDSALIDRALSPTGSLRDKATLICEAAVKQYSNDNYGFHPERHPPLASILEVFRASDPLKNEVKALFDSVAREHPYNFLKVPLGPYFWMK